MKTAYQYTTQAQVRAAFWEANPDLEARARQRGTRSARQNRQNCDTRCAWVGFVDGLSRSGDISARLAERVTL